MNKTICKQRKDLLDMDANIPIIINGELVHTQLKCWRICSQKNNIENDEYNVQIGEIVYAKSVDLQFDTLKT